MSAGTYNFTVEQGTTMDIKLVWKDPAGTVVPITGYSARMQVRATQSSGTILAEFKTDDDTIKLGPADGEIHILADDTETTGWSWPVPTGQIGAQGVYDLEMVSGAGVVTRLIEGTITLDPEVTR